MKIVKFLGGLGNQMFQYAFLLSLQKKYNESVLMDTSVFKTYNLHNGFELDRIFKITARKASIAEIKKVTFYSNSYFMSRVYKKIWPKRRTEFRENHFYEYYPDVFSIDGDCYFDGYWQSCEYFKNCRHLVQKEFSYLSELDKKNRDLENYLLNNEGCVSIHVRRGDYLEHKLYKGLCGLEYYKKAIELIRKRHINIKKWVIFSNDISWCKDNLLPLLGDETICFVDWNVSADSFKDMRLMSACRINILANSSFSWWAAYLNGHTNSEVYAPEKWVNLPMKFKIQMPDWILL